MRFARLLLLIACLAGLTAAHPIDWWDVQRRGGNSFNGTPPDRAYFDALAGYHADWVRLTYDKWKPAKRDFLIGDADAYQGLVAADLAVLRATLDRAQAAGLKVVIAPLSLPGARWTQLNGDVFDDRLWSDKKYWAQASAYWRDLARALRGHPAIAGYNLINEPVPEKLGGLAENAGAEAGRAWYAGARGTARDLPQFYREVIAAIREVDSDTPVMVDAGWYGSAGGFAYWDAPIADAAILYAFHMYEPWAATSGPNLKRKPPFVYPGPVYGETWDAARVARHIDQALDWADAHGIPRNRMVAGEFGCMRRLAFCPTYLNDVLDVIESAGIHWAFYAFREDVWDGMDYELGAAPVPGTFWYAPSSVPRGPTPQFEPILRRLRAHH